MIFAGGTLLYSSIKLKAIHKTYNFDENHRPVHKKCWRIQQQYNELEDDMAGNGTCCLGINESSKCLGGGEIEVEDVGENV